ncbi:MAG TPA: thiaminase II [Thermoprotei archaeon]|nr:MAG: thiaminase II [Thermoprotei archaeon]HDI75091.1 thiaminase II [Thermoprotei archaeon]
MYVKLSEKLYRDTAKIWFKILSHPFVVELYEGRLPLNKFKYYVIQDYNYLVTLMKCYSIIAAKADPETAAVALKIAYLDATIEIENYKKILKKIGLSLSEVIETEPAPTALAYMNFLYTTCSQGTSLEGLVATLPCFWTYLEIAEKHRNKLDSNPVELYREWCQAYLSKEYRDLLNELKTIIDNLWNGENYKKYLKIFKTASKYEYMFWTMAYNLEKWPI